MELHSNPPTTPATASYSVVSSTSTSSSEPSSSSQSTSSSSSSDASSVIISGQGDTIAAEYKTSKDSVELQFFVSDVTSWISVSNTDLAGGVTLEPNKTAKTTISKDNPVTITLGVVKGVTVKIDNQEIDTSKLAGETGWIKLTMSSN